MVAGFLHLANYISGTSLSVVYFSPVSVYKGHAIPAVQLWKNILYRKERSAWDRNSLLMQKTCHHPESSTSKENCHSVKMNS